MTNLKKPTESNTPQRSNTIELQVVPEKEARRRNASQLDNEGVRQLRAIEQRNLSARSQPAGWVR